jgi:hypothetical protein
MPGCNDFPECNNGYTPNCQLVNVANSLGACLEDIGDSLIVANAFAIGFKKYTVEQALEACNEIVEALDTNLTDLVFRDLVNSKLSGYPGLVEVSGVYIAKFNTGQLMDRESKAIIQGWLRSEVIPTLELYTIQK